MTSPIDGAAIITKIRDIKGDEYKFYRISIYISSKLLTQNIPLIPLPKWVWKSENFTSYGFGIADTISGKQADLAAIFSKIYQRSGSPEIQYIGGMRFDTHRPISPEWASWGDVSFWLPRFEIIANHNSVQLVVHLKISERDTVQATLQSFLNMINAPPKTSPPAPPSTLLQMTPEKPQWDAEIQLALSAISRQQLEKVVLGRSIHYRVGTPNTIGYDIPVPFPNGMTHFVLEPSKNNRFWGCSPEPFYIRNNRKFITEAVAGTRVRGTTRDVDNQLATSLMTQEKDRHEHYIVKNFIIEKMKLRMDIDPLNATPTILKLPSVQHLQFSISGTLFPTVTDAQIIDDLLPTPAVGGYPQKSSVRYIRTHEHFDRGWYSGLVGRIGVDHAHWVVAIRSCRILDDLAWIYGGAGIVPGSNADDEWNEIDAKLAPIRNAVDPCKIIDR